MNIDAIRVLAFVCVFGGALFGMFLRAALPEHQLSADSKDTVRLGMGLIGTMSALVLGLLIASAKSFYDTQSSQLTTISAKMILLDRVLAHYGPESKEARDLLRSSVTRTLDRLWPKDGRQSPQTAPASAEGESIYDAIQNLTAKSDTQRALQAQAVNIAVQLGEARWLMYQQASGFVSVPVLAVVVFWLAMIFISFGLFAPRNAIAIATLFVCATSVSGAIFLIVAMYRPFQGIMQISSAPLRNALAYLGQ